MLSYGSGDFAAKRPLSLGVVVVATLLRSSLATGDGDSDEVSNAFHAIDVMCHMGSLLQTVAFMQHNMLALRTLEMISAFLHGTYSLLHSRNATDCHFLWAIMHFAVNGYHVVLYLHRRFATKLSDEDCALLAGPLSVFSTAEFAELKRHYRWETRIQGEDLLMANREVSDLLLLTTGCAEVLGEQGELIKTLDAVRDGPQFIGEMSFFTHEAPLVTVRVSSPQARCVAWEMQQVRHLAHSHGHSLEASTFRQLPSLFARQLVSRVQTWHKKERDRQDTALDVDDASIHHVTGNRMMPWMFKSGRVVKVAASSPKSAPAAQARAGDDLPGATLYGPSLAAASPNDLQTSRAEAQRTLPDISLAASLAIATPKGDLRSLAWAEDGSSPAKSSGARSVASGVQPFSTPSSGQSCQLSAEIIGTHSRMLT